MPQADHGILRSADDLACSPESTTWTYRQTNTEGKSFTYNANVTTLRGAIPQELRGNLGIIIQDLLTWAASEKFRGHNEAA